MAERIEENSKALDSSPYKAKQEQIIAQLLAASSKDGIPFVTQDLLVSAVKEVYPDRDTFRADVIEYSSLSEAGTFDVMRLVSDCVGDRSLYNALADKQAILKQAFANILDHLIQEMYGPQNSAPGQSCSTSA